MNYPLTYIWILNTHVPTRMRVCARANTHTHIPQTHIQRERERCIKKVKCNFKNSINSFPGFIMAFDGLQLLNKLWHLSFQKLKHTVIEKCVMWKYNYDTVFKVSRSAQVSLEIFCIYSHWFPTYSSSIYFPSCCRELCFWVNQHSL